MISKRADSAKGAASPLTFIHNINCPFESCRFVSVLLLSLQIAKWKEQANENNHSLPENFYRQEMPTKKTNTNESKNAKS